MYGKIALEECWAIPENFKAYDLSTLAPKGGIGGDLIANLLDVHGQRLQQMDENGVDMMILSLSSPGVPRIPLRPRAWPGWPTTGSRQRCSKTRRGSRPSRR